LPTLAEQEDGVASTEAFTCQFAALACLAIAAGRGWRVLSADDETSLIRALPDVPAYMKLELDSKVREIAQRIARSALSSSNAEQNYPLALKNALLVGARE
jgi:glucosamine--fructose-6-phosphate aminotransferase (isomerizing)